MRDSTPGKCIIRAMVDDAEQRVRESALAAEARHLHACLFPGRALADRIAARYVRAHDHVRFASDVDVARIVQHHLDAEAIEYWLRRRRPGNGLTQRLRTLLYLVEIEAPYYRDFVRDRGSFVSALPALIAAPLRSAWKLLKGSRQARRHHVV
jgi:hypothetical protein